MIGVIYHDVCLMHRPPRSHVERPERALSAYKAARDSGVPIEGPYVENVDQWILKVHEESYVRRIERICREGAMFIDGDTYVSPGTCKAAKAAVGGVLKAVDKVLNGEWNFAFVITRPPGHHAGRRGKALTAPTQGFCIFNNVAVGAVYALEKGLRRIAIVDIDVHHGNGTQEIFYNTSNVLYISTHQDPLTLYPGTGFIDEIGVGDGEGYNINMPLPPGTADDAYKEALERVIRPILDEYKPDLILVSLGFDAHKDDYLANLELTLNSYAEVFKMLKQMIGITKGVIAVLEGGYNLDVIESGTRLILKIMSCEEPEPPEEPSQSDNKVKAKTDVMIKSLIEVLRQYWKLG